MSIPNVKVPGVYTHVNLNAQRTGLPANVHKVLLVSGDELEAALSSPLSLYDKASADAVFGADSEMGRMVTAAIKTNRIVNIEGISIDENSGAGGGDPNDGGGSSGGGSSGGGGDYTPDPGGGGDWD